MSPEKQARMQFGTQGKPVPALECYVADMAFDHDGKTVNAATGKVNGKIETKKWILIVNTPEGQKKRCHLQTYDGRLGKNVDWTQTCHPIPEGKEWEKKLKGYTKVDISTCPVAIPDPSLTTPPTPEGNTTPENTGAATGETPTPEGEQAPATEETPAEQTGEQTQPQ